MTAPPVAPGPTATAVPSPRSARWRVGRFQVLASAIVLAALATAIALAPSQGTVSATQRRADFTAMVGTLRSDLGGCNAKASAALSAWQRASRGQESRVVAARLAQLASRACAPAAGNSVDKLTLYSLPSSLDGLHLDYAVSSLGVWAQEDVSPAMTAEADLLRRSGDPGGVTTYNRLAGWADDDGAIANTTLRRAAHRLGITGFTGISLTQLTAVSS
ncbi:MAG TPA: hypothetical protein VMV09_07450 [Candidatus Saccharimonadales bacterium]|nr:hypothetical protein [Candidatus Saccharimonadales bacterium]